MVGNTLESEKESILDKEGNVPLSVKSRPRLHGAAFDDSLETSAGAESSHPNAG